MLMRTDPFREFDRLAQQVFGAANPGTWSRPVAMPMDAYRTGEEFVVHFDLPGVHPEAIELDVERDVLTVKAERRPLHGAENVQTQVAATILNTPELRALWEQELAGMRVRIKQMRDELVKKLAEKAPGSDFDFVREQVGMFSYSGLTKEQVEKLRAESIYAVDTGRICVAALNSKNIDRVVDAIAKVL